MPQVVGAYVAEKDFGKVDKVKRDILSLYRGDIEKFGGTDALRIRRVFSTLPGHAMRRSLCCPRSTATHVAGSMRTPSSGWRMRA